MIRKFPHYFCFVFLFYHLKRVESQMLETYRQILVFVKLVCIQTILKLMMYVRTYKPRLLKELSILIEWLSWKDFNPYCGFHLV